MSRGFEILGALAAIVILSFGTSARAADATPEICQSHDDKTDAAAVDAFFVGNLKEHDKYTFSRPSKENARAQAKSYLEQRIAEKRAEVCAAHLKLIEDIKAAPGKFTTADCGAAAVVGLLEQYLANTAGVYDQNRQLLGTLLEAHLKAVKLKLFDIARGSTAGLEGTSLATAAHDVKFEWIKQEASKLGGEAHLVWGASSPDQNPLLQRNLVFAREAVRAKQERDSAKTRFHTDGKISPSCKLK